jgi:hypothetical protein
MPEFHESALWNIPTATQKSIGLPETVLGKVLALTAFLTLFYDLHII